MSPTATSIPSDGRPLPVPAGPPAADAGAWAIGERLASLHARIAAGPMRRSPVFNPALRVEAIGFRRVAGRIVGVLATPWFLDLVVAADPDGEALREAPRGAAVVHDLPGGDFSCVVGEIEGFGRLDSASLFSPMFDFDDPAVVRAVAEAVLDEVLTLVATEPTETAAASGFDRRALLFGRGEASRCR